MNDNLPWFLGRDSHLVYRDTLKPYVVLDFETTNLDKGSVLNPDNRIVLACWYVVDPTTRKCTYKYKFGDEYQQQELVNDISNASFVVAHNAKFEAQWLARCGVDLHDVLLADTMLAQWVLDGNIKNPKGLEALGQRYGLGGKASVVSNLIKTGVCPSEIRRDWLEEYCRKDIDLCWKLFRNQVKQLDQRNQLHIFHTRNLTCAVLADVEVQGMTLDSDAVLREYRETLERKRIAEETLAALAPGVNLGSPKQVAAFLYDELGFEELKDRKGNPMRTAKGGRATGSDVISQLPITTEKQREFISAYKEFNQVDALLSKNLLFFQKVCEERQCKFYGVFNQGITGTHRLSSSGRPLQFAGEKKTKSVQFQNMPRQYKKLFCSGSDDYLIGEADGAQLEFRVAADLGHDPVAYEEIATGADVHSITAKTLTKAGQPTTRQQAKAKTFSPLFGGMGKTAAEQSYCKFFKEKYEGISNTQTRWCLEVGTQKYLVTSYGMRFFWPDARTNRNGYLNCRTEVMNYPVQSFATAEIIPIALVHAWHGMRHMKSSIINTIHDSLVCKVHKDEKEEWETVVKAALTSQVYTYLSAIYGYNFKVPLGMAAKCSRLWAESKEEIVYDVYPDGREHKTKKG